MQCCFCMTLFGSVATKIDFIFRAFKSFDPLISKGTAIQNLLIFELYISNFDLHGAIMMLRK